MLPVDSSSALSSTTALLPLALDELGLSRTSVALMALLGAGTLAWILGQVRAGRRRHWATEVAAAVRARDAAALEMLSQHPLVGRWGPGLADVLAEFEGLMSSDRETKRLAATHGLFQRARMEQGAIACAVVDTQGCIQAVSDEACWLFSRSRKALTGMALDQLVEPEEPLPRRYLRIIDGVGGSATKRMFRTRPEHGEPLSLLSLSREVRDSSGATLEEFFTFVDLTAYDTREPREALRLEGFAGEVAHEFNDRLTAILGNAAALTEGAEGERVQHCGRRIVDEVTHARGLTGQLLALSRRHIR